MRDLLLALGALLVLGAVAVGGWWLLTEGDLLSAGEAPTAQASDTADAFLAAWEAGDPEEVAAFTRQQATEVAPVYRQFVDAFEGRELRTERGEVAEVQDGRARVPVAVTAVGPDDELRWEVELELLRERGRWGVEWRHDDVHPQLRPGLLFDLEVEELDRAPIRAHDGTELAVSGGTVVFGFEPGTVEDPEELADAFEAAVPGAGDTVERTYARGNLVEGWFYPVTAVTAERAEEVRSDLGRVPGVLSQRDEGRTLLEDGFAQHVVGRVAEPTAEQLEELGDDVDPDQPIGQYGLERVLEDRLLGQQRTRVVLREGEGGPVREVLLEGGSADADGVTTTLDVAVQRAVERALVGVDDPAAVVVVDAADGAVRASASRPLAGYHRAFEGRYPPGSAFKIVTAEALLTAGATPADEATCPGEVVVGGLRVGNAGDLALGTTTLQGAFAASCNTTFAQAAADLGGDDLAAAAERFGFGQAYELPLSAVGGEFPAPADPAELAAAGFGQARVEVSPLHLATVAAAARSGVWHAPYLLVEDGPGPSASLSDGVLADLRELLRAVITDGTGTAAEGAGDPPVEGKTGTAQASGGVEHAWFAGSWGELGFAVLVEEGGSGAEVAAPIAGRLVRELQALADG